MKNDEHVMKNDGKLKDKGSKRRLGIVSGSRHDLLQLFDLLPFGHHGELPDEEHADCEPDTSKT